MSANYLEDIMLRSFNTSAKMDFGRQLLIVITICIVSSCSERPDVTSELATVINPTLNFKPNILWLVAEDMSPNIPAYGDSTVVTPILNRLASEGVTYDNFYSPAPVCAPARAAIITGMYPNSIGAGHMRTGPWYAGRPSNEALKAYKALPEGFTPYEAIPDPEIKMFSEILRTQGYYCTNNAKEDYQFVKTPTAWDENSRNAHWRKRPKGKPFFSIFNFGVTHESRIWAKADDSLWVDQNLEVPVPPYLPDTDIGRRDIRRMYSNIREMDYQVGEILRQLEEDGLMDSTIVIWYTDHGGPLPRQKRLLHESGLKVPMIVRFPGKLFAGQRDDRLISFIDLAPTMLSLVGTEPLAYMDGKAFLGDYARKNEPKYIFAAADRFDEVYDRNRAVKDKRFKYIKYHYPEKPMFLQVAYRDQQAIMQELYRLKDLGQLTNEQKLWFRESKPHEELFDTWNDPHEVNNLAENPEYVDKLEELRNACNEWTTSINDTALIPESDLIKSYWPEGTQPQTSDPLFEINESQLSISCETEGASIGYRVSGGTGETHQESWMVYNEPITLEDGQTLEVIAHRIGFLPSQIITQTSDR